jgi:Rrf2 family protein
MSRVVHISEAATIGLHSMIMIARANKMINIQQITELTKTSPNHLAKVMQRLVKANFLKSTRGPMGGFQLRKDPKKITILNVYEAIEGPIEIDACPMDQPACPFDRCLVGTVVKKATEDIIEHFRSQTLADFI